MRALAVRRVDGHHRFLLWPFARTGSGYAGRGPAKPAMLDRAHRAHRAHRAPWRSAQILLNRGPGELAAKLPGRCP